MVKYTLLFGGAAAALGLGARALGLPVWAGAAAPLLLWGFVLSFFRDPERTPPADEALLISPADGTVCDVGETEAPPFLGEGKCFRIGIFLSVFNVHVNRAPCAGKVVHLEHKDGAYRNALDPASVQVNERQDLGILHEIRQAGHEPRQARVMVRQIAGAIARRIICEPKQGQGLARCERYGMIKFGSRTEVYLPAGRLSPRVRVGDKVKGGETVIGAWI